MIYFEFGLGSVFLVIHHRLGVVDRKKKVIIFVNFEWLILPKLFRSLFVGCLPQYYQIQNLLQ